MPDIWIFQFLSSFNE